MKKTVLSLALIVLISFTSCKKEKTSENIETEKVSIEEKTAVSGNYKVDKENSIINWTGSKPAGKHTGTISLSEGNFITEEGKVTGGDFTINMESIDVTDLKGEDKTSLEAHLKGTGEKEGEDHFFNITKYPTSAFKIISLTEANGAYIVKGILTLKKISKEVEFLAEITVNENEINFISDPFKINRTIWGVNYASKSIFDDLKDKFVDDDIELTVKIKAKK